ncbi:AAA family ATPase [Vibrio parahaemolyticus]|uniref:AAA family ATPase n=1 Tax=Vibrio parahaemolyticus TaxID=670 RepID=UPI0004244008|nr:AAA family ATPase [Vibrio parahaemolyticus]
MGSVFITGFKLEDHPYIRNLSVDIDKTTEIKPIVITGKNGTGKTTLLNEIYKHVSSIQNSNLTCNELERAIKSEIESRINMEKDSDSWTRSKRNEESFKQTLIDTYGYTRVFFNVFNPNHAIPEGNLTISLFKARRFTRLSGVQAISKPKVVVKKHDQSLSEQFLQYLVNRKTQQAFAISDQDEKESKQIQKWFDNLNSFFSQLFGDEVKFIFDRENLSFRLEGKDGYIDFNTLSDGYSSAMDIITEIVMRMEVHKFGDYSQPGIVFIDEIETHLHISLQKQILPLLCTFFPNVQFIVTTHSPFVLTSVRGAAVYDMGTNTLIKSEDELWQFGYEDIVEGYFDTDSHSDELENKIDEYEALVKKADHSVDEARRVILLRHELEDSPTFKMPHVELRLRQLGLKE